MWRRWWAGVVVGLLALAGCADPGRRLVFDPGDAELESLEAPEYDGECAVDEDCRYNDTSICPDTYACIAADNAFAGACLQAIPPRPEILGAADCGCVDTVCRWFE